MVSNPRTPTQAQLGTAGASGLPVKRRKGRQLAGLTGYLFIAPAVIFLALVIAYPLFHTFRLSLFDLDVRTRTNDFVGLEHYVRLLGDDIFWLSLRNTIVYTIGSVVLHLLVGGFLALLLNEAWVAAPVRNMLRGLFILPWLFSTAASALMWALLYQPVGPLNYLLQASGLAPGAIDFLGDRKIALWSVIVVNVWKYFPFYMIMILGNLQSIPADLYEAARVDGAGRFQRFRFVTLPLLRSSLIAITAIDFITTFGVFDIVKLMTNGGPVRATQTAAYYLWQVGLRDVNFGYGSAISVVMLIIVALSTLVYLKLVSRGREKDGINTTSVL